MEDEINILKLIKENYEATIILKKHKCFKKSISSAYYVMFLTAKICVDPNNKLSKHSAVISAFGQEISNKIPECKKLHRYLIETEKLRNLCDYHAEYQVSEKDVEVILMWLKEFERKIVTLQLAKGATSALYFFR